MTLVRTRWDGHVAHVTLNRPDRLNAITAPLLEELVAAAQALEGRTDCRAVVLSGEGCGFCAGIDLEALQAGPTSLGLEDRDDNGANLPQRAVLQWRRLPVPVIAAIHGVAFGGGLQLALGADIRLVAPAARLSIRELQWGLVPDMAGMLLLPAMSGRDRLAELLFSAREFDGDEAVRLGICTRREIDPLDAALALAGQIAGMSPSAVRAAKRLLAPGTGSDPARVLRRETTEQIALLEGAHHREAVAAGMAGRMPIFED
ncbi:MULTISPECIES: crotonase/enoyl-CoA hydratase family protein [Sphingobium]|uniref:crotonase/enoyl-CoA hydratase family protein n=1 Tax=Sphingobium TaxID=165695 RepID=UPI00159BF3E8